MQYTESFSCKQYIHYILYKNCVLCYFGRTGELSGQTIEVMYLISEPELYLYLTVAKVRQFRHSINSVFGVGIESLKGDVMLLYS